MMMNPMNTNSMNIVDTSDKGILESLEYYFSIENLNKDGYMRSKMNEDGYIDCNEIVVFNKYLVIYPA